MDTGLLDENDFGFSTISPGYIFTFLEFISHDPLDTRVRTRTVFVKSLDFDRVTKFLNKGHLKHGSLPYLEPGEFDDFLKNALNPNKDKITNTIKDILHGRIVIRSRENALREV